MRTKTIIRSYISEAFKQNKFKRIFIYGSENLEIESLINKLTSSPVIGGD